MPPFIPKRKLDDNTLIDPSPSRKRPKVDPTTATKGQQQVSQPLKQPAPSSDDSESPLSDIDSDEFEDVPPQFRQSQTRNIEAEDSDDEDEIDWEDAGTASDRLIHAPLPTENISISIDKPDDYIDYGPSANKTAKKGPSKREKAVRIRTHQMHVQFLLYHNLIRNNWASDKGVQNILVGQLPTQIRNEVDKWRRASGLSAGEQSNPTPRRKQKTSKGRDNRGRSGRDWGRPSLRLEPGTADMSRGDPLISLLKVLSAYWKKKFAVTAPGLRKRGYSTRLELRRELDSYRRGPHDPELHGELLRGIADFREAAKKCKGSRDVGAQLFTALLRGLGIEARLVASLQPAGYGWTKAEQMTPRRKGKALASSDVDHSNTAPASKIAPPKTPAPTSNKKKSSAGKKTGAKDAPIELESDEGWGSDSSSGSVLDVTPTNPTPRRALFDRELAFPIYWSEAISPITFKPIPCSPLVLEHPVATTDEYLAAFEPRGAKAEASKLVMAYVIGYSADNTAKDLTVRYLRKHVFPGKAKPFRFPVQSIPVYSSSGEVKCYEDYDWFKNVLSCYMRPDKMRTATDDLEDTSDLIPQEPEKKQDDESIDTLSSLKANPDFVLERHLRREEALRPGAKPDRMFISGKEPNFKSEPVYRRSDVERCLTAESWHKEGRRPKQGEVAMKLVPVRAVTITRKREAEEHERITGQKQLQGLYSWDQTEYIIPPSIENGVIPKNSYGNIDAFVPSMVPQGAVHIPLKGTVRICKKLDIDFAEAVVGFEFGNKRAVPVVRGVVVAEENEKAVREAWEEYDELQRKKEETKMERLVLETWRRFVMGLRIVKEVGESYGNRHDDRDDFGTRKKVKKGAQKEEPINVDTDENLMGGFVPDDETAPVDEDMGGGFLLPDEEEDQIDHGDLVLEDLSLAQDKAKRPPFPAQLEASAADDGESDNPASSATASPEPVILRRSYKGKEKEEQYPTPVSIPASREREVHQGRTTTLFHASKSLEDTKASESDSSSLSEIRKHKNKPQLSTAAAAAADPLSSSSEPSSSDTEPEYLPPSSTRRRQRQISPSSNTTTKTTTATKPERQLKTHSTPMSAMAGKLEPAQTLRTRSTRASAGKGKTSPESRIHMSSSSNKDTATPGKGRARGRPKKVITSPYFEESD